MKRSDRLPAKPDFFKRTDTNKNHTTPRRFLNAGSTRDRRALEAHASASESLPHEKMGCITSASNASFAEHLNKESASSASSGCDLHSQVGEWRPRFATCLSSTAEYGFVESHLCDECFCIAKHFSDPFRGIWQALKNIGWEA